MNVGVPHTHVWVTVALRLLLGPRVVLECLSGNHFETQGRAPQEKHLTTFSLPLISDPMPHLPAVRFTRLLMFATIRLDLKG